MPPSAAHLLCTLFKLEAAHGLCALVRGQLAVFSSVHLHSSIDPQSSAFVQLATKAFLTPALPACLQPSCCLRNAGAR